MQYIGLYSLEYNAPLTLESLTVAEFYWIFIYNIFQQLSKYSKNKFHNNLYIIMQLLYNVIYSLLRVGDMTVLDSEQLKCLHALVL